MAKLLSVNVGRPREIAWREKKGLYIYVERARNGTASSRSGMPGSGKRVTFPANQGIDHLLMLSPIAVFQPFSPNRRRIRPSSFP